MEQRVIDKIKLTNAQIEAIGKLNDAMNKCTEVELAFVYEVPTATIVAVNLNNAELRRKEECDEYAVEFEDVRSDDEVCDLCCYEVECEIYDNDPNFSDQLVFVTKE